MVRLCARLQGVVPQRRSRQGETIIKRIIAHTGTGHQSHVHGGYPAQHRDFA